MNYLENKNKNIPGETPLDKMNIEKKKNKKYIGNIYDRAPFAVLNKLNINIK